MSYTPKGGHGYGNNSRKGSKKASFVRKRKLDKLTLDKLEQVDRELDDIQSDIEVPLFDDVREHVTLANVETLRALRAAENKSVNF